MTSHHDVAARLRERVHADRSVTVDPGIYRDITDAIEALESQAKALSEHEVAYDGLMKAKETFRAEAHRNAARALAAEASLAEAMSIIGFYADPRRYDGPNQRNDNSDPFSGDDPYIRDVTRDGGAIARAFTNAAKSQESKDAG